MKNEKAFSLALGLCLALLASPAANSAIIQLRAYLNGTQEVPPNLATPATGAGVMTFDTATRQLTWSITYSGLQSAISDAHFHGPTPAGVDAGVQVAIGPGASPLAGSATLTIQQAADLLAGQYYITIHSNLLLGGEIRGQVIPVRNDFNGDGRADILWRESTSGSNAIWQMNGTTLAGSALIPSVSAPGWTIAGRGDFDGDGKNDILWRNTTTGENAIWLMDGFTLASGALITSVPSTWSITGVGDFDGDGLADILWRESASGLNAIWQMNGVTLASSALIPSVSVADWTIMGVGDFDGDGKADIVWSNTATGDSAIWLMNGFTLASSALIPSVPTSWVIAGVGDFSGEGRADILWRNTSTGENAIWLMNGATLTSSALIPAVPTTWAIVGVGDYNGDALADILWRESTGLNAIWLMNGFTLASSALIPDVPTSWSVAPAANSVVSAQITAGELVITEIMADPSAVADVSGEWFEIYNASARTLDLMGLVVQDNGTDSFTITTSLIIPAGGYLVFGRNGDTATNGGVTVNYVYSGMSLANASDQIEIVNGTTIVDRVAYGPGFPLATGVTMNLNPLFLNAVANDTGSNWCPATVFYNGADKGTPGAPNSSCP